MDFLASLLLATLAGLPSRQDAAAAAGSDAWVEAWQALDALARSAPDSAAGRQTAAELESFRARRERAARKSHDRVEAFRSRVLEAQLSRLARTPFRPVADPRVPIAWLPGEAWIAAEVAAPGPTRVAAIEAALAEALPEDLADRVRFAFATAAEDVRALRLAESRQVAWALYERMRIAEASDLPAEHAGGTRVALLLALVSRRMDEHAEALAILERSLGSAPEVGDRRDLLVELGRNRIAAGEDAAAKRALGEALALGAPDAGWLLGRSALSEGVVPRARALFRTLISSTEAGPTPTPALRGYGISLLAGAGAGDP